MTDMTYIEQAGLESKVNCSKSKTKIMFKCGTKHLTYLIMDQAQGYVM